MKKYIKFFSSDDGNNLKDEINRYLDIVYKNKGTLVNIRFQSISFGNRIQYSALTTTKSFG